MSPRLALVSWRPSLPCSHFLEVVYSPRYLCAWFEIDRVWDAWWTFNLHFRVWYIMEAIASVAPGHCLGVLWNVTGQNTMEITLLQPALFVFSQSKISFLSSRTNWTMDPDISKTCLALKTFAKQIVVTSQNTIQLPLMRLVPCYFFAYPRNVPSRFLYLIALWNWDQYTLFQILFIMHFDDILNPFSSPHSISSCNPPLTLVQSGSSRVGGRIRTAV